MYYLMGALLAAKEDGGGFIFFFFWEEWSAGIWRHDPRVLKMTLIPNLNKFDFDINNFQKSVECYIYCVYINEYYIIKLVTDKRL